MTPITITGVSLLAFSVFLLSYIITGLATYYANKQGLLDQPGERHSHVVPTPRGGGAGPVTAITLMTLVAGSWVVSFPSVWLWAILPGFLLLAAVGAIDDHRSVSPLFRFLVQLLVSIILIAYLHSMQTGIAIWMAVLGGLMMIWMTNLYNFMDGSHGMAGFQGVFAATAMAVLFYLADDIAVAIFCLIIALSLLGFLPWNFPKPRVFMGDVASGPLGYLFAALIIYVLYTGHVSLPAILLVMAVFVADSTMTLLYRAFRGQRWYTPHKQHIYQRLIGAGWSHSRVMLLYQIINIVLIAPAIVVIQIHPQYGWYILFGIGLILMVAWLLVLQFLRVEQ